MADTGIQQNAPIKPPAPSGSGFVAYVTQDIILPKVVKQRHMGEGNKYIRSGLDSALPTNGELVNANSASIYWATDTEILYIWTGDEWLKFLDSSKYVLSSAGVAASRPSAGTVAGQQYFATDTLILSIWTGAAWKSSAAFT